MRTLGLDASTQSLSALIIDTETGEVIVNRSLNFGQRLPQYGSPNGFLPNPDPAIKHSDPLMWIEALDTLLQELRASGVDLSSVQAVSGAGQQHGSVYLARALNDVGGWSTSQSLVDQVRPLLSRPTAPIWMDGGPQAEAAEITAALGGDGRVVALSGSRAIPRFTGPQIRKFFKDDRAAWDRTVEIHLVSSFVAGVLTGSSAPIDRGDGAGMNLLELGTGDWNADLLNATAPNLRARLRTPVASTTKVGTVAEYFVKKFGFAKGTPVVAFTGDNPSSLVGMGATQPGSAVISLGTSDTVFAAMAQPRTDPRGYGHVFGNPAGGFMALACFANGSLAREEVARRFGLDWDQFSKALTERTRPGNNGNFMLPFFVPEITPRLTSPLERWVGSADFVARKDGNAAARAVVEAQALNLRLHSRFIGEQLDPILVTGGASQNRAILQVLADVFQARMLPLSVSNSSALGGALRAAQAVGGFNWSDLARRFSAPQADKAVLPNSNTRSIYEDLGARFETTLNECLAG
jgi:xylulokinase